MGQLARWADGFRRPTYNRFNQVRFLNRVLMAKRTIDSIDMEAEREGFFVRKHNATICKPFGWNKGIMKQRKMIKDGEKRVECKTIKFRFERAN